MTDYSSMTENELCLLFEKKSEKYEKKKREIKSVNDLKIKEIIRKTINDLTTEIRCIVRHCRKKGFFPVYLGYEHSSFSKVSKSPHTQKTSDSKTPSNPSKNASFSRKKQKTKVQKRNRKGTRGNRDK